MRERERQSEREGFRKGFFKRIQSALTLKARSYPFFSMN